MARLSPLLFDPGFKPQLIITNMDMPNRIGNELLKRAEAKVSQNRAVHSYELTEGTRNAGLDLPLVTRRML